MDLTLAVLCALGLVVGWHGISVYVFCNWPQPWRSWPIQFSVLAVVGTFIGLIVDNDPWAAVVLVVTILFPPVALFWVLVPVVSAVLAPAAGLGFALALLFRHTRRWAPVCGVFALVAALPWLTPYYDARICAAAAQNDLTNVHHAPFWHNLRRAATKHGRDPYAYGFDSDGAIWDWSYANERFVPYGGDFPGWVDLTPHRPLDCGATPLDAQGNPS